MCIYIYIINYQFTSKSNVGEARSQGEAADGPLLWMLGSCRQLTKGRRMGRRSL